MTLKVTQRLPCLLAVARPALVSESLREKSFLAFSVNLHPNFEQGSVADGNNAHFNLIKFGFESFPVGRSPTYSRDQTPRPYPRHLTLGLFERELSLVLKQFFFKNAKLIRNAKVFNF